MILKSDKIRMLEIQVETLKRENSRLKNHIEQKGRLAIRYVDLNSNEYL